MSGTWAGSIVNAVCPTTPSPFRTRVVRRASASAPPPSVATRWMNSAALFSYSKTTPPSSPEMSTARETIVVSPVARSSVELTARQTSPRAVSWSTELVSSAVRACNSLNRRTFSIAMTAWAMAGVDLYTLQRAGAWKTQIMVQRYAHLSPDYIRAAVERLANPQSGSATGTKTGTDGITETPESAQVPEK